tara:strand:+ start:1647 stop:2231 length:585 start_codon:yes stop_codon:yes gene_type:complete
MPNGRRRQQNTRHANRNRNLLNDNVVMASPVFETPEPLIVQSQDISVLEKRIEDLEKSLSKMKELEKKYNKIKNIQKKYDELKNEYDMCKRFLIQEQKMNTKYKAKIKELIFDLEQSKKNYRDLDKASSDISTSTKELVDVTMKNRIISAELVHKLKRVKSELPKHFDIPEWNNEHFVNYLIDLTLEDLSKLKF